MGRIPEGNLEEGGYKSPSIQHIWPHHRSMARLFIEGLQPSEVARITGFSLGQVSRILGSPAFQVELNRLAEAADGNAAQAAQILLEHAPRAACVLVDDLYQEVEGDNKARNSRQNAARDVLDRTGYPKRSEPPKTGSGINLTQINIEKMQTKDLFTQVMDMLEEARQA